MRILHPLPKLQQHRNPVCWIELARGQRQQPRLEAGTCAWFKGEWSRLSVLGYKHKFQRHGADMLVPKTQSRDV
jgi:hypothetical protein